MRVSRWSRAPGQCEHVRDETVKKVPGPETSKLKFMFSKLQKLVGLGVVWYVIGW